MFYPHGRRLAQRCTPLAWSRGKGKSATHQQRRTNTPQATRARYQVSMISVQVGGGTSIPCPLQMTSRLLSHEEHDVAEIELQYTA